MTYNPPPYSRISKLIQNVLEGGDHLSTAEKRVAVAKKYIAMEEALMEIDNSSGVITVEAWNAVQSALSLDPLSNDQ